MKPSLAPVVAAITLSLLSLSTVAADQPPADDRSTPGSVVPSTGTTAASQPVIAAPTLAAPAPAATAASQPGGGAPARAAAARTPKPAGSLSGPSAADCAVLRRRYAESQACFEPYRLANGGIKPEAARRCREVPDPATQCGPETSAPGR